MTLISKKWLDRNLFILVTLYMTYLIAVLTLLGSGEGRKQNQCTMMEPDALVCLFFE